MSHPTPGRPRVLDDVKRHEICAILSAGCGIRQAARYVGCGVSTIHREAQRNDQFREQLRQAEAAGQLRPLEAMNSAIHSHWRAAAWMLERTVPDRFALRPQARFGRREANRLMRMVIEILESEIDDPTLCERLVERTTAAIEYATRHACDTRRRSRKLRQVIEIYDHREASAPEPLPGAIAPPSQQQLTQEAAAGAASHEPLSRHAPDRSSVSKPTEFCSAPPRECSGITDETARPAAQNDRVLT